MKKQGFQDKHKIGVAPNKKIFHDYEVNEDALLMDYLLKTLTSQSRNNVKTLLSNRQVLVNKVSQTKFNYELKKGDKVTLSVYPDGHKTKSSCPFQVLYEDRNYIAINKPSGVLSVNLDDKSNNKNAYYLMQQYIKEIDPRDNIFIVHRIDRDTSGVLLFAKSLEVVDLLQASWNELVKTREYDAICEGIFTKKEGTKISYLVEGDTKLVYSIKDENIGKKAITHYKVINESNDLSLVRVKIDTGRKNQIRVHMLELGHGVVGDKKYHIKSNPISRLGLHARTLAFFDPFSKKEITIVAPTPMEFKKLFKDNK
jgi:23S rRNA pseudouridine1911/1915/1917 synthase